VQQAAAVDVVKSVSPTGQVTPGTTLTYTIAVHETTANPTANVVVTDAVPAGTSYVSCTTTIGTCNQAAGTVTYSLGNIGNPNGFGAATLTMTVTVNTPAVAGISTVNNTANYTLNAGASTPTNTVSNTVLTTPAVTIVKAQSATTDANTRVAPSATITYTLTVTNPACAVTATNVTVSDPVPMNTTYVSCAGGLSCSQSSGTVTWIVGTMKGGSSVPLTMVVTVNSPAFDGDTIDNSATVSANNGQGGSYTSPSNIVSYPIVAAPILSAVKSAVPASGSTVSPGNTITYTVIVTNSGNANTLTAVLHDAIPAGTTYVT